jgi:L-arabinose isomerase
MNLLSFTHQKIKPRLAVVVTTWSHESGASYASELVKSFPSFVPPGELEIISCNHLLESEDDIPIIMNLIRDANADALCLIPGNFTLDHIMPLMAQEISLPTLLWGLPTIEAWGALVSVQQTVHPFKELELPFKFVTGYLDDPAVWERILPYVRASALINRLKGTRVGMMGWRAQGMSDVVFDELSIRRNFGVQLINIGLTRYNRTIMAIPDESVEQTWDEIKNDFDTDSLPEDVRRYGIRSYLALKKFVDEENLQAITLECFHDHLGGPCLGFCMLNDQGIAAPCENDVLAAILMMGSQLLSGEPTFHTDIVEANYKKNSAIFHHCGNLPLSLATPIKKPELKPIRETAGPGAYGPTIQAWMKPGPATAANLVSSRGGLRMCALEGETLALKSDLPGSGAWVSFSYDLAKALETLGNQGYGHHFVIIQGHVGRELAEWCELAKIKYMQPN